MPFARARMFIREGEVESPDGDEVSAAYPGFLNELKSWRREG